MNILVTGAGGFIGSHLVEMLVENGHKVKAFVHYNSRNSWGWLEQSTYFSELEVTTGDVRDFDSVYNALKGVQRVFHLAALIGIPYSYISPKAYIETNINGTYNVLQSSKELGIEQVIITSTSEVYGTAKYVPIDEKHPKQPQSPYSASKIGGDAMAMSYYNAFELPVKIVRPFNTYGPRQSARAIIPTIISQIASGTKEINIGDLTPTRDFIYVKDTCLGFLSIAKCEEAIGKEINISSNREITMSAILNMIQDIMKSDVKFIEDEQRFRSENSEVFRLWGDNTLINRLTGFKPEYDFRKGLEITCDWFKNPDNLKKYKTRIYNV